MNKILILLTVMYLCINSCKKEEKKINQQPICTKILEHWEINSVKYQHDIQKQNDLFFPSNNTGYSIGNAGSIMKTTDSGKNWEVIEYHYLPEFGINPNSITKARLLTVYFVDESIGYVGGEGEISPINDINTFSVLLKTVDGGQHWEKNYIADAIAVHDLLFFDANKGIGLFTVKNANNHRALKLLRTANGGEDWNEVILPIESIKSYTFVTTTNKIMLQGIDNNNVPVLLKADKNGENWVIKNTFPAECNKVYFIDDENGFASCGLLFYPEDVYQTQDGGESWTPIESPLNVLSLIHFKSLHEGFIINPIFEQVEAGGETRAILQFYEVFQTLDGGINWVQSEIDKDCNVMGVNHSPSKNILYSLGNTANKFEIKD